MLGSRGLEKPESARVCSQGEVSCSKELKVAWVGKQASEVEPTKESECCQEGRRRHVRKRKDHSWELIK